MRDIEACLRGSNHLYVMGIRGNITRTNLAYANEFRDWRVYEALAQILIRKARRLYTQDANGLDIDELVFKWIKQNLRIKAFYGTSENAVRTQIWIAICVYLMVACLNKIQGINESLSRIMQILSVNVFQKEPVY